MERLIATAGKRKEINADLIMELLEDEGWDAERSDAAESMPADTSGSNSEIAEI